MSKRVSPRSVKEVQRAMEEVYCQVRAGKLSEDAGIKRIAMIKSIGEVIMTRNLLDAQGVVDEVRAGEDEVGEFDYAPNSAPAVAVKRRMTVKRGQNEKGCSEETTIVYEDDGGGELPDAPPSEEM